MSGLRSRREAAPAEPADAAEPASSSPPSPPPPPCAFIPRPLRVLNIVGNEALERFAFYGVRALLVLFLTSTLRWTDSAAVVAYSVFSAVAYLSPLLGGYLADTLFGKLRTILGFNALYALGLLALALGAFLASAGAIVAGLLLIGLGAGGIKPNISPFGAEQIEAEAAADAAAAAAAAVSADGGVDAGARELAARLALDERKRSFFSFFYWALNIGAVASFLAVPSIRAVAGFGWAFVSCLAALLLSIVIFALPLCWRGAYYDASVSKDSAWARFARVSLWCCARQCARGERAVRVLERVDPLLLSPAALPPPPIRPVDAAALGAMDGPPGIAPPPKAAAEGEDLASGAGESDALLGDAAAPKRPRLAVVAAAAGGDDGGAIYRASLFARDDDFPGECQCVNSAMEHALEQLVLSETATSREAAAAGRSSGGSSSGSSSASGHDGRAVIVLLRGSVATSSDDAVSSTYDDANAAAGASCCCRVVPSCARRPCCARAPAASPPHAALLPFDVYARPAARARLAEAQDNVRDVRDVLRLLPLFAALSVFWLVFDVQGSVWLLQRLEMSYCLGALCLEPEALGVLNPLFVVLLLPLFDQLMMPCLARCGTDAAGARTWRYPSPLRRMAAGMQIAALAFVASGALQVAIAAQPPRALSMFLQAPQFLLLTVAEILVSITGLEFAYAQSPQDMRSTVLALYLLSISAGDLLAAAVYAGMRAVLATAQILFVFAGLVSAAGFVFLALAAVYKETQ